MGHSKFQSDGIYDIYVYVALTRVKNPLCSLDRAAAQNLQQIV